MPTRLLLGLILITQALHAQNDIEEKPKVEVSPFSAQFMISTNLKGVAFSLVGAGIRYTKRDFSVSITIFPTLTFHKDHPEPSEQKKPFVRPTFAAGPLVKYKRVMLGFPSYYQDDTWHFSAGIGLKIGD